MSEKIGQLKLRSSDGKFYLTDVADAETLLRLIQSIPSPKAEPFKLWLARVGYERLQEIENPELAMERMKALYEKKGYPKSWIDKRLRGIAVRDDLTDEWEGRGAGGSLEYAILTMLAEATTTTLTRNRDSRGFDPLKKDARDGGSVAGRTRKDIGGQTGKKVVSGGNFLPDKNKTKMKL